TAPVLKRLEMEGLVLKPVELLLLLGLIRTSRRVRDFVFERSETAPGLTDLVEPLPVLDHLEQALARSLGPDGEVLDTASAELARVRREFSGLRGAVQNKLAGLMRQPSAKATLQDELVTRRAGRYVIPVRASSTREVPGLVHDYSKSGATAFVEPLEVVEDNNRLNLLRRREKQEVEKVLAQLSYMAARVAPVLGPAEAVLARIDGVFAQARLSRDHQAVAPVYDPSGAVDLRQARHPLLLARSSLEDLNVVPVHLKLEPADRVMVLSGVNAGGKTVALKTMGLLALMAQAGLHLPVTEGSRLTFFSRILASIGDEQDIQSDLSTFSGHVRRLSWILQEADDKTLVLLDELGTGTDPAEGAALALAVLDELTQRGAYVITATHYHLLKAWAHLTPGAKNAAVRTDTQGKPVFGLDYGAPGFSAGLAMARELGMETEVVDRAEEYLDEGQKKTLSLMHKLEEERASLARTRMENEALQEELAAALARSSVAARARLEFFNQELNDLRRRVDEALRKAEQDFQELRRRFKEEKRVRPDVLVREFRQAKSELREAVQRPRPPHPPLTGVKPGHRVRVASLGREGQVLAVDEAKSKAEIDLGGVKVKTWLSDLVQPESQSQGEGSRTKVRLYDLSSAPTTLNLLGLTVEEALPEIDKSLDQAMLEGRKSFVIIHGLGTGRLRQAVRGYLKSEPRVKDFHPGDRQEGGEGVTMVHLND
ncbi:MAG: Smr/MutS family protein, partial [Pseudomonadota bacterium]